MKKNKTNTEILRFFAEYNFKFKRTSPRGYCWVKVLTVGRLLELPLSAARLNHRITCLTMSSSVAARETWLFLTAPVMQKQIYI